MIYQNFSNPPSDWLKACKKFLSDDCLKNIDAKLCLEAGDVYPPNELIFRALELTPFESVKVIILGQDPYHGMGEACGLAFAVPSGVKTPPSLKNLAKELKNDLGQNLLSTDLTSWAQQGVLLLNRTLSVLKDSPLSHKHLGWDAFTSALIRGLIASKKSFVFVALGKESSNFLQSFMPQMGLNQVVLSFPHPSPLSAYRGFFNSKPFSQINEKLVSLGLTPVIFGTS